MSNDIAPLNIPNNNYAVQQIKKTNKNITPLNQNSVNPASTNNTNSNLKESYIPQNAKGKKTQSKKSKQSDKTIINSVAN